MPITHYKVSTIADDSNTDLVRPSDWNHVHVVTDIALSELASLSTTSKLLGSSSTTTPVQEISLGSGLSLSGTTLTATGLGGTVTSVSVVSANGFAGTVATATSTPAITLTTSITGILKGNGTAISAAVAATDYVAPSAYASTNGLTMATSRLLGRTTALTGAAEEISVAGGLTLTGGVLTGVSGTVTSFSSGNLSPLFTTSVATSTTTPALTFSLSNAAANTYFGNATGSSTAPSFTAAAALTKVDDTNVTLTLGGAPTKSLLAATSITAGWTGTLSGARGGTGVANTGLTINLGSGAVGKVLASDSSGNATWQTLSGVSVTSITGTANQVLANSTSGSAQTGAVTLTTPQDIGTSSTVQFAKQALNAAYSALNPGYLVVGGTHDGSEDANTYLAAVRINQVIQPTVISSNFGASLYINSSFKSIDGTHKFTNVASIFLDPIYNTNVNTITTAYGAYFGVGTAGAGTITTAYNLFVEKPTCATTNYAASIGGVVFSGSNTISTGTWNGSVIGLAYGGTNANLTASNGGIFYSTGTAGAILAGTATANKMLLSGSSTTPSWSTSTIPSSAGATANKVLLSDGTNYVLSTPTFPNASATAGEIIRSDGTNWAASTSTFADTYSANDLLIATSSNTVAGLATANSSYLQTDGSGVVSWAATSGLVTGSTLVTQDVYTRSFNGTL